MPFPGRSGQQGPRGPRAGGDRRVELFASVMVLLAVIAGNGYIVVTTGDFSPVGGFLLLGVGGYTAALRAITANLEQYAGVQEQLTPPEAPPPPLPPECTCGAGEDRPPGDHAVNCPVRNPTGGTP